MRSDTVPRLLVVEEEESFCGLISEAFAKTKFEVDFLLSPHAAVDFFEKSRDCYDLVLISGKFKSREICALKKVVSRARPSSSFLIMGSCGSDGELVFHDGFSAADHVVRSIEGVKLLPGIAERVCNWRRKRLRHFSRISGGAGEVRDRFRLAEEADIYRRIALGAVDDDRSSANVVCKTLELVSGYLGCENAFGYLFTNQGKAVRVAEKCDVSRECLSSIDGFVGHSDVLEVVRGLRVPKIISKLYNRQILEHCYSICSLPTSTTVFVPVLNTHKSYGVLVFVLMESKINRRMLEFLRSVGHCTSLAISNIMFNLNQGTIQRLGLSGKSGGAGVADDVADSLHMILGAASGLVRARGGVILVPDSNEDVLESVVGVGDYECSDEKLKVPLSASLAWECLSHSKTVYCSTVEEIGFYHSSVLSRLCERSFLCVPMVDKGEGVGVMALIDPAGEYDENLQGVLEVFGRNAVQSVRMGRIEKEACDIDQSLEEMKNISRSIENCSSLGGILSEICKGVIDGVSGSGVWVGLLTKNRKEVVVAANEGMGGAVSLGGKIRLSTVRQVQCPVARAIETGKIVVVDSLEKAVPFKTLGGPAGSGCIIPLLAKKRVIGVLCVYSKKDFAFESRNILLLEEFAHKASLAVINSQMKRVMVESKKLKDKILDSVNEAVIAVGRSGFVVSVNAAATSLLGCESSDYVNCSYRKLFGEEGLIA